MRKIFLGGMCVWLLFMGEVLSADKYGLPIPFDTNELFPSWSDTADGTKVQGIIGENKDGENEGAEKLLFHYIPTLIKILLTFAAPIVLVIFLWAGIRLIYHSDNEDDVGKSKEFFMYALMGVLFIVLSYSLLKVLYFLLAP